MKVRYKSRKAFTMLELVFVIVIVAVLAKFGVEFLAQAYRGFINSKINNELQSNSSSAIEFISSRLQYRIKASTIARENDGSFSMLKDYSNATANILEWVGYDIDGYRGITAPFWSGLIDLNSSITNITTLTSPATNTVDIDTLINVLSYGDSDIGDAALYFVNPDSLDTNWGWDANISKFATQFGIDNDNQNAIHPINANSTISFNPTNSNGVNNTLAGVIAYEFYQLAWSAYAVGINDYNTTTNTGTLTLWYDYQPWKGDTHIIKRDGSPTKSAVIMENVSSFRFIARESLIKIQVCVKSLLIRDEEYSICKEKTVY